MKSSTKRNSSNEVIEGVKGVVFFDTSYQPRFVSVTRWEAAGKPPNCFVYDGVHPLLAAGIPVVDAVEVEGRWIRCRIPAHCPPTNYRKHPVINKKTVRVSTIPLTKVDFITAADATKRKLR